MTAFDAILFDKDGTLFDFHATWGLCAKHFLLDVCGNDEARARGLAAAAGFDFDAARYLPNSPLIASTPGQIAACLLPHLPEFSSLGLIKRMNEMSEAAIQVEAAPLIPLFGDLRKRGLTLGVVTNDAIAPTRAHLLQTGASGLLDHVLGCDCGYAPKPAPDMLLAFCEMASVRPERVAMIGDSPGDLIAAKAAGMVPVGVLTGPNERSDLEPLAEAILPGIAQIPEWLEQAESRAA